jgi:hypothetical protein
VSFAKCVRNGVAGALIALVPISTSTAAVRPSAAVPTAGSTAVVAQGDADGETTPWAAWAIIAATILVGVWIAVDKPGEGSGTLSRG